MNPYAPTIHIEYQNKNEYLKGFIFSTIFFTATIVILFYDYT